MSHSLNWPELGEMTWKRRNAAVEAALRKYLMELPDTEVLSTRELAVALMGEDQEDGVKLTLTLLSKLARWVPNAMATHDGEEFKAYGKINKRWRWHGQAPSKHEEWTV